MPIDVTTLEGKHITNESCKGKVTFLNFWFETCAGCMQELPELNKVYDSLKDDPNFQFVAITFESKESIPAFLKDHNMPFPIACVKSEAETKRLNYRNGYPLNIVLDKDGKIMIMGAHVVEEERGRTPNIETRSVINKIRKELHS